MSDERSVQLTIEQVQDYEFRVRFDGTALAELTTDESPPLGHGAGPDPGRLLLAGVANCLMASLTFALRKFRNDPAPLRADARATLRRNPDHRWRIASIEVDLHLADAPDALQNLERALAQFESFCIVTESVRAGVPVAVRVRGRDGAVVHASTAGG